MLSRTGIARLLQGMMRAGAPARSGSIEGEAAPVTSPAHGQTEAMCQIESRRPVNWGSLRRVTPVSRVWGLDRGRPLDRYYIENFLARHRADIHGRVLEIKDPGYTLQFGTGVTAADVLDVDPANGRATIVADLSEGSEIPADAFDCFVFTQTLHIIFEVRAAIANAYRLLKPGGVLLCTVPSVSRVNYEDGGLDSGDFWRFTHAALRRLFAEQFPSGAFTIEGHGNVLTCAAFLYGLSPDELTVEELDYVDPWFPLIFCVRAVKPAAHQASQSGS